jgi:hypothetical protein
MKETCLINILPILLRARHNCDCFLLYEIRILPHLNNNFNVQIMLYAFFFLQFNFRTRIVVTLTSAISTPLLLEPPGRMCSFKF